MELIFAIAGVAIFFTGILVGRHQIKRKYIDAGILRVDRSDPYEPPYLFLQLHNKTANDIAKEQYVLLKVETQDLISQK